MSVLTLREIEKQAVIASLRRNKGKCEAVGRELGIGGETVRCHVKKWAAAEGKNQKEWILGILSAIVVNQEFLDGPTAVPIRGELLESLKAAAARHKRTLQDELELAIRYWLPGDDDNF